VLGRTGRTKRGQSSHTARTERNETATYHTALEKSSRRVSQAVINRARKPTNAVNFPTETGSSEVPPSKACQHPMYRQRMFKSCSNGPANPHMDTTATG
jgi:hypothetical protein